MPEKKPTYISIVAAMKIANEQGLPCTHATMISWVKKNSLGFQALGKGSRINVNEEKLKEFLANGPS